jgi:hypothetical protein
MKRILVNTVLLFAIASMINGCAYPMPKYLRNNFTYRYTPSQKGLDTLIDINGYYTDMEITSRTVSDSWWSYRNVPDTFYMNYLFFEDGIVIKNVFGSDGSSSPEKLPKFLAGIAKDTTQAMALWGTWGTYIVSGDTIKTQFIHPSGSLNDGWSGWEDHFKVINRQSIKLIFKRPLHPMGYADRKRYSQEYYAESIKDEKPAVFIKCVAIPNSDCWMKDKKWFWKNEADYNSYSRRNQH